MSNNNLRVIPSPLSLNRNEMLQVKNDFPKVTQLLTVTWDVLSTPPAAPLWAATWPRDNDWAVLIVSRLKMCSDSKSDVLLSQIINKA